ncbi:HDIG domain-containing metalloprotein [Hippea jasoniae]|uniref:HDIG domain-containing metalloprotein n=1 Tax=Hippea jasoniae TaxID=944479 RepID=UPI0005507114|nr:HDIG domain-containing metalloprotein [Hippea jasoniae]
MNYNKALELLHEYTKSENLLRHALCVETAMRCYAKKFGEDEEKWAITGLLHDFDYEKYPDEHPYRGAEILRSMGVEEEIVEAILGHANYTGVKRTTLLAKTLFAVDELSGFLYAYALVRPTKNLKDVKLKSIKKKLKDKAFARGVNREDITTGAEELGVELDQHILFVAQCLQNNAKALGLEE